MEVIWLTMNSLTHPYIRCYAYQLVYKNCWPLKRLHILRVVQMALYVSLYFINSAQFSTMRVCGDFEYILFCSG